MTNAWMGFGAPNAMQYVIAMGMESAIGSPANVSALQMKFGATGREYDVDSAPGATQAPSASSEISSQAVSAEAPPPVPSL